MEARKRDPKAQLWPEISMSIIGQDFMREGELKSAVEVLKLNLLAYSDSADANETLAEAYLRDGQKELARRHAEKALSILDSHTMPASSWSDTEQQRGEIRKGAQGILKQLATPAVGASRPPAGTVFRDCPDCPEMIVITAGNFTVGSSPSPSCHAIVHHCWGVGCG
jgi:hypothetical protein